MSSGDPINVVKGAVQSSLNGYVTVLTWLRFDLLSKWADSVTVIVQVNMNRPETFYKRFGPIWAMDYPSFNFFKKNILNKYSFNIFKILN